MESWQHATTPPVSLFYALDVALEMMQAEGREEIIARHRLAGEYVRGRAKAMGLELLADPRYASNTVTAIKIPEGIDAKTLLGKIRREDYVVLASGQVPLKGKIFRVGHLGFFTEADLKQAMDAVERRLPLSGYKS